MAINPNDLGNTATLTFADEFNSLSLWNGQSGTWNTGDSWGNLKGFSLSGNGEQQWYINSQYAPTQSIKPWTVSDGVLNITAQPTTDAEKQLVNGYDYTSGQVNTFHSFSQTYGYFEMRAQLPAGQGLWPAFWLLPEDNSWPPEIDVMENLGNDMNTYVTTVHTAANGSHSQNGAGISTPDLSAGFHNYGVDWEADKITWYFDGKQVFQADTPSDMNKPAYMVADLAVGGYWPGNPDASTAFPATLKIDYIHAYTENPNGGSTGSAPPVTVPTEPDPTQSADPTVPSSGSSDQPETPPTQTADSGTQQPDPAPATGSGDAPPADEPTQSADAPNGSDAPTQSADGGTQQPDPAPAIGSGETPPADEPTQSADGSNGSDTPAQDPAPATGPDSPQTASGDDSNGSDTPAAPVASADPVQNSGSTSHSHSHSGWAFDHFDFSSFGGHRGGHGGHTHDNAQALTNAFDQFHWNHNDAASSGAAAQAKVSALLSNLDDHIADLVQLHDMLQQDGTSHLHHHGHHFL
ncbi:MAG: skn1 [Hyphomicrobiales bacterium]|nr:skn1 [Hyphomicrobiales bacterium]